MPGRLVPLWPCVLVSFVYGRRQQERVPRILWMCCVGVVFVFSCCAANHKCSPWKELTVCGWESGCTSFSRHCLGLARSQPRCLHEEWVSYTEASLGCWHNLSPGCRTDIPVFLLVVPVGNSFTFFIGLLSFLPLVCLQHGSLLLPSLQQDLFFFFFNLLRMGLKYSPGSNTAATLLFCVFWSWEKHSIACALFWWSCCPPPQGSWWEERHCVLELLGLLSICLSLSLSPNEVLTCEFRYFYEFA